MAILNPELISFTIINESHEPKGQWNYEVYYTEYFELLPKFMQNSAIGHYHIIRKTGSNPYNIDSEHITCMIPSYKWFCLKTNAKDKFITLKRNCQLEEIIEYECPLILIPLCRSELSSQRNKVLSNLNDQIFEDL